MNIVGLVGRITKDLELKYTPSGQANVTFTLAVNRSFKNAQGEREADFINCVAWRAQAENLCNFKGKGSEISVTGRIQTRSYENSEGRRIYVTEVVAENIGFIGGAGGNGGGQERNTAPVDNGETIDISDDDLPF